MTNMNWDKIISAYNSGLTADMLQAEIDGKWGVIWTVAPCNAEALERAGRQYLRSRARRIRHIRRAILHHTPRYTQDIVIATELPTRCQQVRDLDSAQVLVIRCYLQDDCLNALEAVFVPVPNA